MVSLLLLVEVLELEQLVDLLLEQYQRYCRQSIQPLRCQGMF
jgi:hypothetical protein